MIQKLFSKSSQKESTLITKQLNYSLIILICSIIHGILCQQQNKKFDAKKRYLYVCELKVENDNR